MSLNTHRYNYNTKVLEIEAKDRQEIPIVLYPPFKLRSSLYDKDPVIWVHLLESYIDLLHYLLSFDNSDLHLRLTDATVDQFQAWLHKYLSETSLEQNQVLTLGSVNPQINENNTTLRALVFKLVQAHGLMEFNITGATLWHFVRVYVKGNATDVRDLILGNSDNNRNKTSVNLIHNLTNHLEDMIANGQCNNYEIQYFALLVGVINKLNTKKQLNNNNNNNNNNKPKENYYDRKLNKFVDKFIGTKWIQILERYYAGGQAIHSKTAKVLMVITVMSCTTDKLNTLVNNQLLSQLAMKTKPAFVQKYPLLFAVVKSDLLSQQKPDIVEKLEFLLKAKEPSEPKVSVEVKEKIDQITELFPHLSLYQGNYLLQQHNNDANEVTNVLLEDPSIIESIPINAPPEKKPASKKEKPLSSYNVVLGKKQKLRPNGVLQDDAAEQDDDRSYGDAAQALRNKTLQRALKLLYESDEDEPDDTYLDSEISKSEQQEANTARATSKRNNNKKGGLKDSDTAFEDDDPNASASLATSEEQQKQEQNELLLFETFKKDPSCSDRSANTRRSAQRKKLIQETGWSHEQIEGWFRMLEKSPQRVKLLEDKLFFSGAGAGGLNSSVILPRTSYRKKRYDSDSDVSSEEESDEGKGKERVNMHRNNRFSKYNINRTLHNMERKQLNRARAAASNEGNTDDISSGDGNDGGSNKNSSNNTLNANKQHRKKEKNKSKVANHNRKAGRDKKLSKGFQ